VQINQTTSGSIPTLPRSKASVTAAGGAAKSIQAATVATVARSALGCNGAECRAAKRASAIAWFAARSVPLVCRHRVAPSGRPDRHGDNGRLSTTYFA